MALTREQLCYLAKINEQTERYDEMKENMKAVAKLVKALNLEERNLLSVAFKNAIGNRRKAFRIFQELETRDLNKGGLNNELIRGEKSKIIKELKEICKELLTLVDESFISETENYESKVFYWKMRGDYYRYTCEFLELSELATAKQDSLEAYQKALEIAKKDLIPTNPTRLGLVLNLSVLYYEILGNESKAIEIAKDGFDTAISTIDALDDDSYKECTTIMQLIRDNLTLWSNETPDNEEV